jgi:hypothetical protein
MKRILISLAAGLLAVTAQAQENKLHHGGGFYHAGRWHSTHHGGGHWRKGLNPKTQQKIKIPAKTVVKFRVAKVAKDAILGVKK